MNTFQRMNTALMIDESRKIFKVSRQAFVDPDILEAERTQIFDKCWLYLGHSSELAKPGDFVTRQVGGRNILFARDGKGNLKAMLNTCPHRGAQVCREKHGSAKSFQCFYHGWVFGLDGALRSQPGESSYAEDFKERSTSSMQQVPRFESYRDLNFICFDKIIVELKAVRELAPEHRAQLVHYLKATGLKVGLLVNFGSLSAKIERVVLDEALSA